MKQLPYIQLSSGSSATEIDVGEFRAPLFIWFDKASTATVYLDGEYLGAIVTLQAGGVCFAKEGEKITIYRVGDEDCQLCLCGL